MNQIVKSKPVSAGYSITSLGRTVDYCPEQLFAQLQEEYQSLNCDGDNSSHNIRIIMHLYRKLGHSIDSQCAGGIMQLVNAGRHVSPIVINEWCRVKNQKLRRS